MAPLEEKDLEGLTPSELLQLGIDLYNSGQYFEAHEAWEAVWLDAPREERFFYQGLIQITAAFVHLTRNEYPGTVKLLAEGTAKLELYLPRHLGVETARLVEEARAVRERVIKLGEKRLREMDPGTLPLIYLV